MLLQNVPNDLLPERQGRAEGPGHSPELGAPRGRSGKRRRASAIVGLFYLGGLPVRRDLRPAEYGLCKAADRGNELAKKGLASLLKRS